MAHKNIVLIALLLLATKALAQTTDSTIAVDLKDDQSNSARSRQVTLARCAYRQTGEGCPSAPIASDLKADNTLAQMPRRMGPMGRQGPPMRQVSYPQTWGPQFSPGHALIGAAIGFGLGATAGSKNGVRSSLAAGTLVGLIGAAIGAGIPSFPGHFRRRGWDDDDEAFRTKHNPANTGPQTATATQLAASHPEATETYQKNDFSPR